MADRQIRELATLPNGQKVLGIEEENYETLEEQWNVYRLADGSTIRVKAKVLNIFRVVDETGSLVTSEAGTPEVIVSTSIMIVTGEELESQLTAMAADPAIQRELALIQEEFAETELDGLTEDL